MSDSTLPPPFAAPAASAPPAGAPDARAADVTAAAEPPPLVAAAPALPPAPPAAHPFRFHGRADEYFRIWIVNTLLVLLTAGIFLAWAKVRKRRYLRGCTELLGHRFDYRADPRRLLAGHLVVAVLFLAYSVFGHVYPAVRLGVLAAGVILLPWIITRSLVFNAHNTVYRGLRFRFNPSLSAAGLVYLLELLLVPITLGLYYPAWLHSQRRYTVSNHRLGTAYFHFEGKIGPFYRACFGGGAIIFAAALAGAVIMGAIRGASGGSASLELQMLIPFIAVYALGIYTARHYVHARLFNLVWNSTRLDDHRFRAEMKPGQWMILQLGNLGAIVGTCGLLYPWAVIRTCRYTASCLHFVPAGALDPIERVGGGTGSATGDSAAEFIGIDFGL